MKRVKLTDLAFPLLSAVHDRRGTLPCSYLGHRGVIWQEGVRRGRQAAWSRHRLPHKVRPCSILSSALPRPDRPSSHDLLLRWSGITPEALSKAVLTLAEVQSFLLSNLISPRTILLGHSLESDLKALKLRHPWCIDTAILFKHPKGPPYKPGLKYLAKTLLEKEIQTGEGGHDPEEDARTCLELLEMKLKLGQYSHALPD